ncbi:ribonuclease H2, subunit C [Crucibulum laeve]|uniref:Ribonuclease H2, subunit C n=1 Tax=Crucibulum laeve TaxID=68775 RepID=A0A5C3LNY4_9AGAR|nr:ribonuclease H2, subunit C [Crucibulum laeve]
MAAPVLAISPIPNTNKLPLSTPYLMPFHIDYTGPAPVSTYLRVEAADEVVATPKLEIPSIEMDIKAEKKAECEGDVEMKVAETTLSITIEEAEADALSSSRPQTSPSSELGAGSLTSGFQVPITKRITEATTRFISTFRGRTIQGLKVELPAGYVGIVMRGEGDSKVADKVRTSVKRTGKEITKGKEKANALAKANKAKEPKKKGRTTRSATRAVEVDEEEDEEAEESASLPVEDACADMLVDSLALPEEAQPTRTLSPTSQFSSFMLWHADIPADGGRDEYYRALTEWTKLAAEIHRIED